MTGRRLFLLLAVSLTAYAAGYLAATGVFDREARRWAVAL